MKDNTVRYWMSSPVVTGSPDMPIAEARKLISANKIRALPVLSAEKLVGIVTRRGLLRLDYSFLTPQEGEHAPSAAPETEVLGDIMSQNPITLTIEQTMPEAARIMLENKITALPVLQNEKLVGIITNSDIFRFIIEKSAEIHDHRKVKDVMTEDVWTIDPASSLLEANRIMGPNRIRALPVVHANQMVGIVTRTDLMSSEPSRLFSKNQQELSLKILATPIEKVMSNPVITIKPEAPIKDAAHLMLENKIHALPVLDPKGKLIGIITESDLFLATMQRYA
ncbi:MAG: CBS domain-containing protein [Anaerolineaceae bacterium]|nr:CBS domain-containing protein [Anaerolineaceae bacterium]